MQYMVTKIIGPKSLDLLLSYSFKNWLLKSTESHFMIAMKAKSNLSIRHDHRFFSLVVEKLLHIFITLVIPSASLLMSCCWCWRYCFNSSFWWYYFLLVDLKLHLFHFNCMVSNHFLLLLINCFFFIDADIASCPALTIKTPCNDYWRDYQYFALWFVNSLI